MDAAKKPETLIAGGALVVTILTGTYLNNQQNKINESIDDISKHLSSTIDEMESNKNMSSRHGNHIDKLAKGIKQLNQLGRSHSKMFDDISKAINNRDIVISDLSIAVSELQNIMLGRGDNSSTDPTNDNSSMSNHGSRFMETRFPSEETQHHQGNQNFQIDGPHFKETRTQTNKVQHHRVNQKIPSDWRSEHDLDRSNQLDQRSIPNHSIQSSQHNSIHSHRHTEETHPERHSMNDSRLSGPRHIPSRINNSFDNDIDNRTTKLSTSTSTSEKHNSHSNNNKNHQSSVISDLDDDEDIDESDIEAQMEMMRKQRTRARQ